MAEGITGARAALGAAQQSPQREAAPRVEQESDQAAEVQISQQARELNESARAEEAQPEAREAQSSSAGSVDATEEA